MTSIAAALILLAPPAAPALDARAENLAVSAADAGRSAAVAARDLKRFAEGLAEDVVFVAEGAPLAVGRAAIATLWADLFKQGGPSLTWRPTLSYVASSGDLAYTEGEFLSRATGSDGKENTRRGRYVTVWRKGLDGTWRAVVDIGNRTPGPAAGTGLREAVIRSETSEAGDLQYALIAYEASAPGPVSRRQGRYLVVRRKQPDGSWRSVVSADTAPPAGGAP
jgi:ketosteroid isomerase-like protein